MKREKTNQLSAAQFEIMEIVWELGETTINEVLERINAGRRKTVRRTTIQVQMSRLEDKGWLAHRAESRTFFYRPLRDRSKAQTAIVREVTKRVFGGSWTDLVKCLVDQEKLSGRDVRRLKRLLDEYEQK